MLNDVLKSQEKLSNKEIGEIVFEKLQEKGGTITDVAKEVAKVLDIPFKKAYNGYQTYAAEQRRNNGSEVKRNLRTLSHTSELHKAYKCFFQGEAYEVHVDCNTNEPKIVRKL